MGHDMTKRNIPAAPQGSPSAQVNCDISPKALSAWNPALQAADSSEGTISIYDPIGEDFFGDGVTAKRIGGALRSIGAERDVAVNINSPGGNVFEGLAIYNLLREHKGKVTVNVLGMAASAASFIAMAADEIKIGRAAFFMVHNAWTVAAGNRHDLRDAADWLEPFDASLADIYAQRTGLPVDGITAMLDAETWIGGADAVEQGWADSLLDSDYIDEDESAASNQYRVAAREVDVAMAKAGLPRSKRRGLIQAIKSGTPSATGAGTPSAATEDDASLASEFANFQMAIAQLNGNAGA